ncbi:MAG: Glyoxylate reductase [Verrucomicrobia bacterium]|nr:Glyoxylate reductase [Verrucomicrobiota bacterium]
MRTLSILVWAHLDSRAKALIGESLQGDLVHFADRAQPSALDLERLAAAEVVFGNIPARLFPAGGKLRWIQLESVGFEYYQSLPGISPPVQITNLKGMFEWPAAETAFAGLLALSRGLPRLILAQAEARWIELEVRPGTWILRGRRALVLGAGSIGQRMVRLLQAFECETDVFARTSPAATVRTREELARHFASADLVVCCLPKTPSTLGLVDRALLQSMKPSAVFVNIGRGAVVDEAVLVELLQRRRIGGAVIDVTHAEPLPPAHPLWKCPNTILTQHTAGGYADELVDKARTFLQNLARYRRGEPLQNPIDLEKGY